MSLIRDDHTKNGIKQHQAKVAVEQRPFADTFGPKAQRKRVKLEVSSVSDMISYSEKMHDEYLNRREQADSISGRSGEEAQDNQGEPTHDGTFGLARDAIFSKGQSKRYLNYFSMAASSNVYSPNCRIWNELYKVIDSSDVVIHVLDARDPQGTRCRSVESYIKTEAPHKHLLFVLNKCDLVPTSVAVSTLSATCPIMSPLLSQDAFLQYPANPMGGKSVTTLVH